MELPRHTFWLITTAAALLCAACAGPSNVVDANRGAGDTTGSSNPAMTSAGSVAEPSPPALSAPSTPDSGSRTRSATVCSTGGWDAGAVKGSSAMGTAPLYLVRVGQHACFDRIVLDINGPEPVGYVVNYVPVVTADPSGKSITAAGRAVLQVLVRAPILGTDDQGHQPGRNPPAVGDDMVAPAKIAGWTSLQEVAFAGSFEGQTTIAVGVRKRLPFRVSVATGGGYRHVVIDIAH